MYKLTITTKKDVHKLIGHYSNKIQQNFIWHKPANYIPSSQKILCVKCL